jgi:hypothetical protein
MVGLRNLNDSFTIKDYGRGGESVAAASDDRGRVDPATAPSSVGTAATSSGGRDLAASLSGVWSVIKAVPGSILASLLGFVTLWLFALVPNLRPWTPPEARTVLISDAVVAERQFTLPDDREEVTVVTFKADVTGYAANPIIVATLWLDPVTQRRGEPELTLHGNLVSSAISNQSVGWLDVPYPTLPDGVQGCLVLRVLLLLAPEDGLDLTQDPRMVEPTGNVPLLAYTDTPPFEPYEDGSCAILEGTTLPEPR